MKKTIAILIAALMLLSMIPVNVFAAADDCKVVGEHTKANCAAYTKVETIDPVDCKFGYTLYSCDACGVVFADDFQQKENGHVYETVEAAKAATCSTPAYKEKQVCKVCKAVHPELNGDVVKDSKPVVGVGAEHKWVLKTDIEDCLVVKADFECSVCGATKTEEYDSHVYNDYPDTYVAPTCEADGSASFNCTRCDHVKTIVFKSEGHKKQVIDAVDKVDCTKPGSTAGEYCTVCNKVFTAPVAGVPQDCKWALIETKTPATCDKDGLGVYECTECGTKKEAAIPAQHIYGDKPTHSTLATCTEWGFDFYYCTICGYLKPFEDADKHAPLTHVGYDKGANKYTTGADTCEKDGVLTKVWTCTNVIGDKVCGATCTETVDVYTAHDIKTVVVPAYCHQVGFTVSYCANPDCAIDAVSAYRVSDELTLDLSFAVTGLTALQLVPGKDAAGKDHNGVYAIGTTLDANKHNLKAHIINDSNCYTLGAKYDYCPNCSYQSEVVEIPMKDHKFNLEGAYVTIPANCTDDEVHVYKCTEAGCTTGVKNVTVPKTSRGGHQFTVDVPAQPSSCTAPGYSAHKKCANCDATQGKVVDAQDAHVYVKVVIEPKCDGTKGSIDYLCACGKKQDDKVPATVTTYEYDALRTYNTWAEAAAIHAGLAVNGTLIREGDCTKTGLISYDCSCGKSVLVNVLVNTANGIAYGSHNFTKDPQIPQVNPTCQKEGTGAIWDCTECDVTKGGETLGKVGHDMKNSPCGDGTYCAFNCGTKTGAGKVEHVIVTDYKYQNATCTTIAFIHTYCKNCDTQDKTVEFMTAYAPALGHDFKDLHIKQDSTCTATGLTEGTKCTRCDVWETEQQIIPMKDHVNKDDVKLYDKCTDTTKDRVCVACKQTIGTNHTMVPGTTVIADCNNEGYTLEGCEDCGFSQMTNYVPKTAHTWSDWATKTPATILAEGWETRYCTNCKDEGITTTEGRAIPVLAEIGIVLDATNANGKGDVYTDSSLVAVTVTLDSAKLNAWGVAFDLYYTENLQFVKAEFSANNKFVANATAVDNNVDPAKGNNPEDYVSISAFAPNGEDKKLANVALEGKMEFVTLYFKVVNGEISGKVPATAEFAVANSEVLDIAGVSKNVDDGAAKIEIKKFMDYNADGDVTLQDVLAASKILSGELTVKNDKKEDVLVTYDVVLDVDKDGEITADDLLNILAYINGAKDYADVTKA